MADNKDLFYLDKVFPEPDKVFSEAFKVAEEIIKDGIIVLDTNVLLTLFDTSEKNIAEIKSIYLKFKGEHRFFIPARVAREFANNRANKIGDVYLQVRQIKENLNVGNYKINSYPILEHNNDYKAVIDAFKSIKTSINTARKSLENLESQIQSWTWNDNVSKAYKEIFTPDIIINVEKSHKDIENDLAFRNEHKIAPGFKDSKKVDDGIGDLIIWQTLLELAKNRNRDLIFVTNDQKNDWFYKQDKIALYPRYELFDEFRRYTGGKSVAIINFVKFLELSEAPAETINEIKTTIDDEVSELIKKIQEGTIVEHKKFGIGRVMKIWKAGNEVIADINFEEAGMKSIMVKFAPIKLSDKNHEVKCKHKNITVVPNGVFDDYLCSDCNTVVHRVYGDNSD